MPDIQDQFSQNEQLSGSLQENTLTLLCTSDAYCQLVRGSVPVEYFSTFLYRDFISRVYTYIDQFKKAPAAHLPDLVEDLLEDKGQKGEAVRTLLHNIAELGEGLNESYVVSQLEKFTRQQKLKLGVVEATRSIQDGNLDRAEHVLQTALRERLNLFDAGIGLDDVMKTLRTKQVDGVDRVLLGIPALDISNYGPGRKELHLYMAPFKSGKSWWLLYVAKRALVQKWRVLYVTLEMDPDMVGRRFLQSLYSMTKREVEDLRLPGFELDDLERLIGFTSTAAKRPSLSDPKALVKLSHKLAKLRVRRNLRIKQFPTGALTVEALSGYLDGLEASQNFIPDLLIIDYPDLMKVDPSLYRIALGNVFKELRGIAVERNLALATVTQVNRDGTEAKTIRGVHVSEDISKIAIADTVFSYNRTEDEKKLGMARIFVAAGRDDRDQFNVLLTQAYDIGQYVLNSRDLDSDYHMVLEKHKQKQIQDGGATDESVGRKKKR